MCGVVGVLKSKGLSYKENDAAYDVYRGLMTLQHRGQDAAGIMSFDPEVGHFHGHKKKGHVNQAFTEENLMSLAGNMAIGHNRYATTGSDSDSDLQPMAVGFPYGLAMAHNGNLVNYHSLKKSLREKIGLQLMTHNDVEIMMQLWSMAMQKVATEKKSSEIGFNEIEGAVSLIMNSVDGGYATIGLMSSLGLIGFRDPQGLRPLVLGKKITKDGRISFCLASETIALNFIGHTFVRDILPGEVVLIQNDGTIQSKVILKKERPSFCMFEWVYFAAAESTIEKSSVYSARLRLGEKLANHIREPLKNGELEVDVVCPVPDTSRTASIALAESLGLPYREGLIKNRYVQRSFILKDQESRKKAVELKLSPVRSEIENKNILLVDDSIVRGTTSKRIIELLKKFGAKSVTLAITSPPLRYGCFYGIDFPNDSDLIAHGKNIDAIAKEIGIDHLYYLTKDDLKEAINVEGICTGCIDKSYPTSLEGADEFRRRRREHK